MRRFLSAAALATLMSLAFFFAAKAEEKATTSSAAGEYVITLKDHRFSPATLEVPAGKPFTLVIDNQDKTAEEFESHDLKREKVVKGESKLPVKINALKPGTYTYFGEWHESTAKGVIVAK